MSGKLLHLVFTSKLTPMFTSVVLCNTIDTTMGIDTKFGIAKESIGIASVEYKFTC